MNKLTYILLFLTFVISSCADMNDIIKEYYDAGEINYISTVDSVSTISGRNRVEFTWKVYHDPKIESCRIFWNQGKDSATVAIDKDKITEDRYYTAIVEGLPEGSFIFTMHHIGSIGAPSVPYTTGASVYGDNYEANLLPRYLESIELDDQNQVVLTWAVSAPFSRVELKYTNNEGVSKILDIPETEMSTVIPDFVSGGEFSYETFYIPEEFCLDEFSAPIVQSNFPAPII